MSSRRTSRSPSLEITRAAGGSRSRAVTNCDIDLWRAAATSGERAILDRQTSPRRLLLHRLLDPTVQAHAVRGGRESGALVQVGAEPQVEGA